MEIGQVAWDDEDAVRRFVEVTNAVRATDSPWMHPMTEHECTGHLHWGWDGEPPVGFLAVDGDQPVAVGEYSVSSYDNLHLAWLDLAVHPAHRRRGTGSALLEALTDRARAEGRTCVGSSAWEAAGPRAFADRHGFEQKAVEVNRRQVLADLDWPTLDRLYDEARPAAAAYELVRRTGSTPAEELEATAAMVAAINDAPTDDLDIEHEAYPPQRVAAYEAAWAARGHLLHHVVARHRETGELAGHTVVVVDGERPQLAEQHDTAVVAAHRGHRLGLLLKLEMNRWLREAQPQLVTVDTWNAASNRHMIAVNEALGYRVVGRALAFQRPVRAGS